MSCLLFGFLFTSSAALAYYIAVQMNLNNKMLVMVGAAFGYKNILKFFAGVF